MGWDGIGFFDADSSPLTRTKVHVTVWLDGTDADADANANAHATVMRIARDRPTNEPRHIQIQYNPIPKNSDTADRYRTAE
jgi:hypothetical protein